MMGQANFTSVGSVALNPGCILEFPRRQKQTLMSKGYPRPIYIRICGEDTGILSFPGDPKKQQSCKPLP